MATNIQQLYDLPDVNVIDDIDINTLSQKMIADYEAKYKEITGEAITLYPADPDRIKLEIVSLKLYQGYQYIDKGFKMNLLKYSMGDYLEHLGAFKKVTKESAKAAVTTIRYSIDDEREDVIAIPKGKRVTAGDNVFFSTDEYAEIAAGSTYVDVAATCTVTGTVGNNYTIGQINVMADKIPYISSISNTVRTSGGTEEESDESFKERVYLAPSSYSTAGPDDAYVYWVKQYSAAIADVKPKNNDATVDIRIILQDGELPSTAFCDGLEAFLLSNPIKPLTDNLLIQAPTVVDYTIEFTYYIGRSMIDNVSAIQSAVTEAANTYVLYQKSNIGCDINPDLLIELIRTAGAKRAVITTPSYTVIPDTSIAIDTSITIHYGGVEDD